MQALVKPTRVLLFFALLFGSLYMARTVLVPLTIAAILAMLFVSVSEKIERKGVNKAIAALLCLFGFVLIAGGIVALLVWQSSDLASDMDGIQKRVASVVDQIRQFISDRFGVEFGQQKQLMEQQSSGSGQMAGAMKTVLSSILGMVVDLVLVLVYTFLFLYFRSHLKHFLLKLIPEEHKTEARTVVGQSSQVARQYLTGLAMMIGMLWVLYGIGFSIVGVKHAIFLAILCGLLEMIPFVGNLSGSLLTILVTLAQGGNGQMILGILIVYAVVQFTQTYLIEPLVVGSEVSINPLFTILIIVVGEAVWGIPGMILALPVLGIVKVICDHIEPLKPYGFLMGNVSKADK